MTVNNELVYEVWQDGVMMARETSLEKAKGYYFRYRQEAKMYGTENSVKLFECSLSAKFTKIDVFASKEP